MGQLSVTASSLGEPGANKTGKKSLPLDGYGWEETRSTKKVNTWNALYCGCDNDMFHGEKQD